MQVVNKLTMFTLTVSDMAKAKAFYADTLGLEVTTDYRMDDDNWWVSLALPEGGVTITLARAGYPHIQPGSVSVYFATSDITAAHKEISKKGAKVSGIQDDLFGPGSGVKFLKIEDPDGAQVHLFQP